MTIEPDRLCIFVVDADTLKELDARFEGMQVTFTLYRKDGRPIRDVVGVVAPREKGGDPSLN